MRCFEANGFFSGFICGNALCIQFQQCWLLDGNKLLITNEAPGSGSSLLWALDSFSRSCSCPCSARSAASHLAQVPDPRYQIYYMIYTHLGKFLYIDHRPGPGHHPPTRPPGPGVWGCDTWGALLLDAIPSASCLSPLMLFLEHR
jgi:hypothetical protein